MYKIEGDGNYKSTFVWKDGKQIEYDTCVFRIDKNNCVATVDGVEGKIDRMIISAVYMIISDGDFTNSRVIFCDEMLRGIQGIVGKIERGEHPMLAIEAVLLPNIIEVKE